MGRASWREVEGCVPKPQLWRKERKPDANTPGAKRKELQALSTGAEASPRILGARHPAALWPLGHFVHCSLQSPRSIPRTQTLTVDGKYLQELKLVLHPFLRPLEHSLGHLPLHPSSDDVLHPLARLLASDLSCLWQR